MFRPALLLVAASLAAAPAAAQDRYGPSADELRGPAPAPYRGPLLTWASRDAQLRGREQAQRPAAQPAPRPYRQAALAPLPAARPAARPIVSDSGMPQRMAAQPSAAPTSAMTGDPRVARAYGAATGASTARPGTYAPQTPRRYSLVREFGQQPDPIPLPQASVLAFSDEVGATFAAQNARDGDNTLSPADVDMLEQAAQDDARRETRQKARDKANAAKN